MMNILMKFLRNACYFCVVMIIGFCVIFHVKAGNISMLEENVRLVNGKIEELEKKVSDQHEEINLLRNTIAKKEEDERSKINLNLVTTKTPKEIVDIARDFIDENKYSDARSLLILYLEKNPTTDYAGMMKFYIGESYFREEKYASAAKEYIGGFKERPRGEKAPETLYKLGLCFKKLSRVEEANATFSKLISDFPDATDFVRKAKKERTSGK